MTVLIYVDTSRQVGDPRSPQGLRECRRRGTWFEENDPEAWPLNMRFWNKPNRPQDRLRNDCDLGVGDRLAGARVAVDCKTPPTKIRPQGEGWGRK